MRAYVSITAAIFQNRHENDCGDLLQEGSVSYPKFPGGGGQSLVGRCRVFGKTGKREHPGQRPEHTFGIGQRREIRRSESGLFNLASFTHLLSVVVGLAASVDPECRLLH